MIQPKRLAGGALVVLLGVGAAGCGGAMPAGTASAREEATTPEGALAAFDRAERAIDQTLGGTAPGASQAAAAAPPPAPPPPQPAAPAAGPAKVVSPPPAAPPAAASRAAEAKPLESDKDTSRPASESCATACSALASMARAADHLCGLAGGSDARCASARERLKNASTRVHAVCSTCG